MPVDPAGYARTDCGVLYLNDEDEEAASDAVAATDQLVPPPTCALSVPLFAREIAPVLPSPKARRRGKLWDASLRPGRGSAAAGGKQGVREGEARLAILRERLTSYGL